jgi:NAD(P)-dependent dehydrogenase (short-subunit alcohol dehydrogenase family)
MSKRRGGQGGAIVNLSSMAATIGGRSGSVAYAASNAAVDAFTVGLAKKVAQERIRVNSVRPGMTITRMTDKLSDSPAKLADIAAPIPMARMATVEEIALPILWLLSSEASFVSGCRLDVSGGGFVVGMNRIVPPE